MTTVPKLMRGTTATPQAAKRASSTDAPPFSITHLQLLCSFLIVMLLIAVHKLIDASCGIDQLYLARVERV